MLPVSLSKEQSYPVCPGVSGSALMDATRSNKRRFCPATVIMSLAPEGEERIGDVSNVLFSNGWIVGDDGTVLIYYASSDTRQHVAFSTIDRLLDYVMHTAEDGLRSATSVETLSYIIAKNLGNSKEGVKAGQSEKETGI